MFGIFDENDVARVVAVCCGMGLLAASIATGQGGERLRTAIPPGGKE